MAVHAILRNAGVIPVQLPQDLSGDEDRTMSVYLGLAAIRVPQPEWPTSWPQSCSISVINDFNLAAGSVSVFGEKNGEVTVANDV